MNFCTYIHIPFCKTKCNYCSFCSFILPNKKIEYIDALVKEIKFHYKNETQKTIYFGGGTPSLLENDEIKRILHCFLYDKNTSITFEMNPNDVNDDKLTCLKNLGINRISIGIQSFDDDILKIINRSHNSAVAQNAINFAKQYFDDFSIDLMYGLPNQTIEGWNKTLEYVLELNIPHISLYGLKIEKGTKFYKYLPDNLPNLDVQADMYELAIKKLSKKYIHYEFSNFAKSEKYFSKHNLSYWKRKNYYGFGLSASGFENNKRYTNTFNFKEYIKNPICRNFQELSLQEQIEEEIFLGLRLKEGINFKQINQKYNVDIYEKYKNIFDKFANEKFIELSDNKAKLTLEGVLLSNEILCEFIEI